MSMLAETRKKQKWVLNPRGKDWSNDTNKFGQKMLEKMGWTIGKGLGINEQGSTDHIKIKVKNDTIGIGFKNEQDKAWTEHQKAFDSFLSSLQENTDSDVIKKINTGNSEANTQSLELKSKQSLARVHYQRFKRSKDVKKYSAKDLADIFGGKDILNKENQIDEQQEKDTNTVQDVENISGGTVTINKGSITDYFKKKTSQFLKDKDNSNTNPTVDGSDSEVEQYRGFGFLSKSPSKKKINKPKLECNYSFDNPALDLHNSNDTIVQENTKSLNKRKGDTSIENDMENLGYEQNVTKKIKIDDNDKNCKEGFINMALDLNTDNNESYVTNKFEVSRTNLGLTNDALDLTDEVREKKRVTFNNHVEYSTDSSKKKKHIGTLDKFEIDSKKRKKKQKQLVNTDVTNKLGIINEALEINLMSEELNDNKVNESKSKKSKKVKQRRMSNLETIEEISEEAGKNNDREVENLDKTVDVSLINEEYAFEETNVEIKKKKKKNKNKKHEVEINDTIDYVPENLNSSKKKEKVKKKDKHIAMDDDINSEKVIEKTSRKKKSKEADRNEGDLTNIPLDKNEEHLVVEECAVEDELKKKLKHKKKKDKKHINKNIECELEENIDDPKINEEVEVKVKIKHDINSEEANTLDNSKEDDSTIDESNSKIQLQNMEHPKIIHEENMKRRFYIENSKKSRRLRLFYNLNGVDFPGSNLDKIKDYGVD
ncbi:hypothetical protein M0802_007699 [Mischocyttarus mexicanus]|nr:hypothetical protein M0802_007699 [Mischocyttarus mexicanus]